MKGRPMGRGVPDVDGYTSLDSAQHMAKHVISVNGFKKVGKKLLAEMQFVGQREREFIWYASWILRPLVMF